MATTRWACSPPGWGCRTSSRRPPTRCGGTRCRASRSTTVLVSPDLVAADAVAVPGTASDHLPVAVTLTLPDR
ncbi:hypothetical protein [Verrucosispora sioxanthis]|uniref:hypothetical protein n=1 Tax=Verrucosispora sioxanthis TaxID=2499994 RepID=UPI001C11B54E|nr:hypothetical protein [Verrucosispora sioxanthis]